MKTAKEWIKIWNLPAPKIILDQDWEITIKTIQMDALQHVAQALHDMSRGTHSNDRSIAIDECRDLVVDIRANVAAGVRP